MMNTISTAEDYITSEIREFRQIRTTLTPEEKKEAIDLSKFKGRIFKNMEDYQDSFDKKIFKYGKRFYKYRFKFGIRTRYIGENLIMLGILKIGRSPDIKEIQINVKKILNLNSSHQNTMYSVDQSQTTLNQQHTKT